jgi:lysophospholipase L1-like esterase
VSVVANACDSVDVIVSSNGVQATITGVFWVTAYETFKLINGTSALTDAVLTIGCGTINHRIWVIGDSYTSMDSNERWTYYLNQKGFVKNVMVCGSTGSGREASDRWMNSLLQIGTPKAIVWCMGMNYTPDYENPPYLASDWTDQIHWLENYCNEHGIELILTTTPSVPSRKHEHKNIYVRESGYRYIDFAEAVGATVDSQGNVTWYAGMLSSDNVHPSATGAVALFNKAITTVPEMTYDYD